MSAKHARGHGGGWFRQMLLQKHGPEAVAKFDEDNPRQAKMPSHDRRPVFNGPEFQFAGLPSHYHRRTP